MKTKFMEFIKKEEDKFKKTKEYQRAKPRKNQFCATGFYRILSEYYTESIIKYLDKKLKIKDWISYDEVLRKFSDPVDKKFVQTYFSERLLSCERYSMYFKVKGKKIKLLKKPFYREERDKIIDKARDISKNGSESFIGACKRLTNDFLDDQ